ncbi:MAG: B12-binding domain-containing radical SAM protein [Candidatus Omnitrophica bacterium]|nr:B12-binding domain-containing radical SAM protein [Candidatus Omnitrophota bacterium]
MKKILLVNPWIYDFAAYDFGMKPVGLLRIAEHLRREGNEVDLIDCLAGCTRAPDKYGFSKIRKERIDKPEAIRPVKRPFSRYGISVQEFKALIERPGRFHSIYVTSVMTYWYPGVFLAIKLLKERFPKTPILLGGIYATLCHRHADRFSGADFIWRGDYLKKDRFIEHHFYPAYDLLSSKDILPIQFTEGCPCRCSYCASRILKPQYRLKDPVDLFEEVMHYYHTYKTGSFVFYDDALICNRENIKRFLRLVIASGHAFNFHTPNGLHAQFIDDEIASLFFKAGFRDLRISLETSDEHIQTYTGGKVTTKDFKNAVRNLKEAGFSKQDIGVYILIGAPWLGVDKVLDDIKLINSLGAKAILASYSPIPGTIDFKALVRAGIIANDTDPLWHNKSIFSELLQPSYAEKIQEIRRFTAKLNNL